MHHAQQCDQSKNQRNIGTVYIAAYRPVATVLRNHQHSPSPSKLTGALPNGAQYAVANALITLRFSPADRGTGDRRLVVPFCLDWRGSGAPNAPSLTVGLLPRAATC